MQEPQLDKIVIYKRESYIYSTTKFKGKKKTLLNVYPILTLEMTEKQKTQLLHVGIRSAHL